jgi:hypothetical protein
LSLPALKNVLDTGRQISGMTKKEAYAPNAVFPADAGIQKVLKSESGSGRIPRSCCGELQ